MKFYIGQSGKPTIIAEMNDAHLLNALKHYSVRFFEVRNIKTPDVVRYAKNLEEIRNALKEEAERRNLPVGKELQDIDNGVDIE